MSVLVRTGDGNAITGSYDGSINGNRLLGIGLPNLVRETRFAAL